MTKYNVGDVIEYRIDKYGDTYTGTITETNPVLWSGLDYRVEIDGRGTGYVFESEVVRLVKENAVKLAGDRKVENGSNPDWDLAPEGIRYWTQVDSTPALDSVWVVSGNKAYYWNPYLDEWKGAYDSSFRIKQIEEALENNQVRIVEKENTVKFQVGDIVSVRGVITQVGNVLEIHVRPSEGTKDVLRTYPSAVTLVERPEKEIPAETIVEDSHGCRFILGEYQRVPGWLRISAAKGHNDPDQFFYTLAEWGGKALSKIARESL